MLAFLVLFVVSTASGLAVGAWYAYASARIAHWSAKVEHLKPTGGMAILMWKLTWIVVVLAGTVLPFNLAFYVPMTVAQMLSVDEPFMFVTAICLALLMVAVGHRAARRKWRAG